ncbi:MAG TPA: hypothetical protein PKK69_00495 [Ferruginibacter sp.]|nr:hypothetical protein [Ferruginibacter sp.]
MKRLLSIFLLCCRFAEAQSNEIPVNIFCHPPMPRLNEYITVQLQLPEWKTQITSAAQQQHPSAKINETDRAYGMELFSFQPSQTGWHTLGPYHFESNGIHYVTNALRIHVDDSLPTTITEGLWIRHLRQSDSVWSLTIEQRKPLVGDIKALMYRNLTETETYPYKGYTEVNLWQPQFEKLEPLIWDQSGPLVQVRTQQEECYYNSNIIHISFRIKPHEQPILIDRSLFTNLPANYPFESIVIP